MAIAFFAAVSVTVAVIDSGVVVAVEGVVCLAAVVAIARLWGMAYAAPAAIATLVAYDWFEFPPTHPHEIPDSGSLLTLLLYFAGAVLVGQLAAQARAEAQQLADEQAALRRVATLVARQSPPAEVFGAVTEEVARLLGVASVWMFRAETGGTAVAVARSGSVDAVPVGTRLTLEGDSVLTLVLRTGEPARMDDYENATGSLAALAQSLGVRSTVGTPIVVDGRLWGAMLATSKQPDPLPAGAASRVVDFTDLVCTTLSNAQARSDLAASRARIAAAADDERRRVVRDLHDGAQQRLVHTVVTLKLARNGLESQAAPTTALLTEALDHAQRATVELRELAHGILPSVLTVGGLRAGVDALASRMPVPVDNDVSVARLPAAVEATAYFVVAEALTNVAKHSQAERASVAARVDDGMLEVEVRDDGVGGAQPGGTGLLGLADRLAVLDGELRVESNAGAGTLVAAAIPLSATRPG